MITTVLTHGSFCWIDVQGPSDGELKSLSDDYGLPSRVVNNCLDPELLPKAEKVGDFLFVLLRTFDVKSAPDADSVQEITDKLAVFVGPERIITVHRKPQGYLQNLRERWVERAPSEPHSKIRPRLFMDVLDDALQTFDPPLDRDTTTLENYEFKSFRFQAPPTVVEDTYYLKRRAAVFRRLIRFTQDSLVRLQTLADPVLSGAIQNGRETADHLFFKADDLQEGVNSLLSLHLSLSSQRANDVMKLLTVFSAFFLPLTFIVGIYGMNFHFMPELNWHYGYPFALGLMAATVIVIYVWFKRKRLI